MKSRAPLVLLVAALAFFAGRATRAQEGDDGAKRKKVQKLLDASGGTDIARAQYEEMCAQFAANKNIPPGFAQKFREVAKSDDMVQLQVPIYAKHLDDGALDGALAFFDTEAGKKFAKAQPAILKETQDAAVKWAEDTAQKVIAALEADEKAAEKGEKKPKKPDDGDKGDKDDKGGKKPKNVPGDE